MRRRTPGSWSGHVSRPAAQPKSTSQPERTISPRARRRPESDSFLAPLLADHDLGRLDDREHLVPDREPEALGRGAGDHRDQLLVTNADLDLGHQTVDREPGDLSTQTIAGADRERALRRKGRRPAQESFELLAPEQPFSPDPGGRELPPASEALHPLHVEMEEPCRLLGVEHVHVFPSGLRWRPGSVKFPASIPQGHFASYRDRLTTPLQESA